VLTSTALGSANRAPASDRIVVGGIGIGNMGRGDQNAFLNRKDVQYIGVCEVRAEVRDTAKGNVDKKYGNHDCQTYDDFRELLARSDVDAVHIATPDHWHAVIAIEACRQGKDVYCQKPETLTLAEGPKMIAAARRYGRVFSGGSQRVLGDYRKYVDPAWAGEFGTIKSINVNVNPLPKLCNLPAEAMKEKIDWEMWLGPAPWAPYNADRCSGSFSIAGGKCWRAFSDYSGGGMTDWGAHHFGGATFIGNVRELQPSEVNYHSNDGTPYLSYRYPNGLILTHNRPKTENLAIEGTPGEKLPARPVPGYKDNDIYGDFIQCVKTREKPFRDIELAVNTAVVCHLGNIAYVLQRSLKWDAQRQEFPGDSEANRLVDRARRAPWQI
jgi:hypothetical protein